VLCICYITYMQNATTNELLATIVSLPVLDRHIDAISALLLDDVNDDYAFGLRGLMEGLLAQRKAAVDNAIFILQGDESLALKAEVTREIGFAMDRAIATIKG
jgi:hypothetical protein